MADIRDRDIGVRRTTRSFVGSDRVLLQRFDHFPR